MGPVAISTSYRPLTFKQLTVTYVMNQIPIKVVPDIKPDNAIYIFMSLTKTIIKIIFLVIFLIIKHLQCKEIIHLDFYKRYSMMYAVINKTLKHMTTKQEKQYIETVLERASYHYFTPFYEAHIHDDKVVAFDIDTLEWVELTSAGEIDCNHYAYYKWDSARTANSFTFFRVA